MAKVVFAGDQTNWPVCVCVSVLVGSCPKRERLAQSDRLRLSCDFATWVFLLPARADRL